MMRKHVLLLVLLISAAPVRAQLPAPNAAGVSAGHIHMMVRDPAAHKKLWVDVLGAEVTKTGSLELLRLPGIFLTSGRVSQPRVQKGRRSIISRFASKTWRLSERNSSPHRFH
ncbi:MAG TPA: hypothetical protein VN700_08065 [Vicinamibacterales bacterium]|nr:hypothetical protein [Vicinamibacterales bacterium]